MVFQTKAGSRLFTYSRIIIRAKQDLPAWMNIYFRPRPISRVVHAARDRVPLRSSLQIPLDVIARFFRKGFMND
jgi:hypothetical protein